MYLTIDSFEAFLNSEDNQELIDEGIFEFILWVPSTKSWVLKRVTDEDEMDDYLPRRFRRVGLNGWVAVN